MAFRQGNSAASSNKRPVQILEMRTTNCKSASCKRRCRCSKYSCPSKSCTADLGWYIAHWHTATVECYYRSWCRLALLYQEDKYHYFQNKSLVDHIRRWTLGIRYRQQRTGKCLSSIHHWWGHKQLQSSTCRLWVHSSCRHHSLLPRHSRTLPHLPQSHCHIDLP
jgi:hypothetical protein